MRPAILTGTKTGTTKLNQSLNYSTFNPDYPEVPGCLSNPSYAILCSTQAVGYFLVSAC